MYKRKAAGSSMKMVAIDFGGTRIKIGLVDSGKVVKFTMLSVLPGCRLLECLDCAEQKIRKLLSDEELEQIQGIGISYPGLVNWKEKRVIQGNEKYSDAVNFDFKKWVSDRFRLPFVIDNDANAALLGELHYGCGAGVKDAVIMILGTGVGTAAVMEGRIVRGKHFQAGCLGGHFPIGMEERKCTCPGTDCVEAYASTWALPRLICEHPLYEQSGLRNEDVKDFEVLKKYVERKDAVAADILNHCIKSWSKGIIGLIYAYDPEVVILSGGITNFGEDLLNPIIQYVHDHVWTPWGQVEFRIAENKEHSVLLGLSYLMVEELNRK
jgi:glucokinase